MAQNINYGSEIKNGGTIKSEHVSQFVDAFTGAEAYDINISGSLNIVGTTSGSFIGDGSGLTGITGGGGTGSLTTKAGFISSASFQETGSGDSFATVTFETPFSSSDYSVAVELNSPSSYYGVFGDSHIGNKTTTGFDIFSDLSIGQWGLFHLGSGMDYIAVANTETSVFTIPTSSFGLNTKIGTIPTSSYTASGSYSVATVTFATPFSSSDYSISHLTNDLESYTYGGYSFNGFGITDKTPSGFTFVFFNNIGNLNSIKISSVDYIAAAQGETAVTSSFTLLSATASYVEQAQTASYVEIFPYTGSAIISGSLTVEGDIYSTTIRTTGSTVSNLPSGIIGQRSFVTDSTEPALGGFGRALTGSGANSVPVFYNGTQWLIG